MVSHRMVSHRMVSHRMVSHPMVSHPMVSHPMVSHPMVGHSGQSWSLSRGYVGLQVGGRLSTGIDQMIDAGVEEFALEYLKMAQTMVE